MKKNNINIIFTIIGLIGLVVLVVFLSVQYVNKSDTKKYSASCENKGSQYNIDIKNDQINPTKLNVKICDTATVTNFDNKTRLMAFGHHDSHKMYDGIDEKELTQNQSFNFTFNEAGEFTLHDHNQEDLELNFLVTDN